MSQERAAYTNIFYSRYLNFPIFVRCVALRNLELFIKTGWNVFVRFVAENAGRG